MRQHCRPGFARRCIVGRHAFVNAYFIEVNAFVSENLEELIVHRPEVFLRPGCRSKTILVGNHHKFEFQFAGNSSEPGDKPRQEAKFLEAVNFLIFGLVNQRAVAVNEEYFFQDHNF